MVVVVKEEERRGKSQNGSGCRTESFNFGYNINLHNPGSPDFILDCPFMGTVVDISAQNP